MDVGILSDGYVCCYVNLAIGVTLNSLLTPLSPLGYNN